MAGQPFKRSSGSIRLGFLVGVLLALVGVTVAIAAITEIHPPANHDHTYSDFGCGFSIKFNGTDREDQGTPDPSDDEYTWEYFVEDLNGPGCGLSHWVLELCQPEAFGAFVGATPPSPDTGLTVNDPGTTGLTGVKWNDIVDPFLSGTFTVTLSQNFALDPDVAVGFKTGAGVIAGPEVTVEGPLCNGPVGGIVQLQAGAGSPAEASGSVGGRDYTMAVAVAAGIAGAVAFAGGWYARRHFRL